MACSFGSWTCTARLLILTLAVTTVIIHAQNKNPQSSESDSNIYADVFGYVSDNPGKCRADVYVQIPYSEINFLKEGEQYTGRFEISITLLSQEKQQVWQKNQLVELILKDVSQTVSNKLSNVKQFSADLVPGKYELDLQVVDQGSKKISKLQRLFELKDFNADSLALSDLMLVNRVNIAGERKNIVPNITGSFGKVPDNFYLFFEIYNRARIDSVRYICKFINSSKQIVLQRVKNDTLSGIRTQMVWQIDTPSLAAGQYSILIEAQAHSKFKEGQVFKATASRSCIFRMENLPLSINDIDKATDQLMYIAKNDEIDFIKEASTQDEKLDRFIKFWSKRDPDPKTLRNELMEEYYSRVDYANKSFIGYSEGWRSDRGMVLIRFGVPQNIDRHPFDTNSKPYEIWYYYNLNREFVFVDYSGFGDYRLQYPEKDLWGRIR